MVWDARFPRRRALFRRAPLRRGRGRWSARLRWHTPTWPPHPPGRSVRTAQASVLRGGTDHAHGVALRKRAESDFRLVRSPRHGPVYPARTASLGPAALLDRADGRTAHDTGA